MAGGVHGRDWGMHGRGTCLAGQTATAEDGRHPTGMHSCYSILFLITRMHSSRMPTVCNSSHLLWGSGGLLRGVPAPKWVPGPGRCLFLEGLLWGEGGGILACTKAAPPPVNRITDKHERRRMKSFRLVKTNFALDFLKNNTSLASIMEGFILDKIQCIVQKVFT